MIRNLHLTIVESVGQRPGRTRPGSLSPSGASALLGNPDDPPVLLDPDNPDDPPVLLDPDNPDDPPVLLDPDNPDDPPVLLDPDNPDDPPVLLDPDNPDGPLLLTAARHAHGTGCCCGCASAGAAAQAGARPALPGLRTSDYNGFVVVRTGADVDLSDPLAERDDDDGFYASLHELAEDLGLDALKGLLELSFLDATGEAGGDGEAAGGDGAAGQGEAGGAEGAAAGAEGAADCGYGDPNQPLLPPEPPGHRPQHGPANQGGKPPIDSFPLFAVGNLNRAGCVRVLRGLESKASRTSLRPFSSLTRYWALDLRRHAEQAGEVVTRLNELSEIDLAYRQVRAVNPLVEDQNYHDDAPVGIGLRAVEQLKKQVSTASLSDEDKITVCDLEQQWRLEHLDLAGNPPELLWGANLDAADEVDGYGHHGNAVLGQLIANGRVKGGVVGDDVRCVLASHYLTKRLADAGSQLSPLAGTNGHVAAAIVNVLSDTYRLEEKERLRLEVSRLEGLLEADRDAGLDQRIEELREALEAEGPIDPAAAGKRLGAGDVLLLEVQRGRYPTEIDAADFDAIRLASALGVVVVEAAGNGGRDLDAYVDPDTGRSFNRRSGSFRDSGAIMVGAAYSALPHDRAPFSNHGSRVDCFAWGTGVTTCGYGNLDGDERENLYTNTFNGTSSAAPMIATAAVQVQAFHRRVSPGSSIGVAEMRRLLSDPAMGTPQGRGVRGHIGVMPDLPRLLGRRLSLAPDVYLRHQPGADGSTPGARQSVSSSPDVVVAAAGIGQEQAEDRFGEEGTEVDRPAPGDLLGKQETPSLHVRLRNRGAQTGHADVHLFAYPATTLITPELWHPVGEEAVEVPPGDLLRVRTFDAAKAADGIAELQKNAPAEAPPLSFLAVAVSSSADDGAPSFPPRRSAPVLPPGPPHFDWRGYVRFLRSPNVAWRNVHRVQTDQGPTRLRFFIAGSPDLTRRFDLEVVQRLPEGAGLSVVLHRDAAAKLRQRQVSLQRAEPSVLPTVPQDHERLILPRRPRLPVERLALDAGMLAEAVFELTGTQPETGHSLAIRQLWRGVEVGRITWCFEKA
jgi:hypothetical protein